MHSAAPPLKLLAAVMLMVFGRVLMIQFAQTRFSAAARSIDCRFGRADDALRAALSPPTLMLRFAASANEFPSPPACIWQHFLSSYGYSLCVDS